MKIKLALAAASAALLAACATPQETAADKSALAEKDRRLDEQDKMIGDLKAQLHSCRRAHEASGTAWRDSAIATADRTAQTMASSIVIPRYADAQRCPTVLTYVIEVANASEAKLALLRLEKAGMKANVVSKPKIPPACGREHNGFILCEMSKTKDVPEAIVMLDESGKIVGWVNALTWANKLNNLNFKDRNQLGLQAFQKKLDEAQCVSLPDAWVSRLINSSLQRYSFARCSNG